MDKDLILDAILATSGVTVSNRLTNILQISCPVCYSDSDPFMIYLEELDGQMWLFDAGETIARLEDTKTLSNLRYEILDEIVKEEGGELVNRDIRLKVFSDLLGVGLIKFIQILTKVDFLGAVTRTF